VGEHLRLTRAVRLLVDIERQQFGSPRVQSSLPAAARMDEALLYIQNLLAATL
jgi:hypothetical protein